MEYNLSVSQRRKAIDGKLRSHFYVAVRGITAAFTAIIEKDPEVLNKGIGDIRNDYCSVLLKVAFPTAVGRWPPLYNEVK